MNKKLDFKNPVEDFGLFANILRNSGYKSVSYAASEIIDNSIDADASNIIMLFESEGAKIKNICFLDNGNGMDLETLWKSVTVGGRFEELQSRGIGKRGKYGFGLPGASAGYSEIVEVYTWGPKTNNKIFKVFSDLKNYSKGILKPEEVNSLPDTFESMRVNNLILKNNSGEILINGIDFKKNGTLVIWKGCERVKPVTTKILIERYLRPDLSRIFRHFLTKEEFSRKFAPKLDISFIYDREKGKKPQAFNLNPNDPMFLMKDTEFSMKSGKTFNLDESLSKEIMINGAKISIRFSIAPKDPRME